ncbi:hypothetical protein ACWCQB_32320 [Streptomyces hirsutus]
MLASLLPGLRELRTPLAIGYLYALSLYLLLGDSIPSRSEAGQQLQPLYDAAHWLGKPVVLAAGAFLAYLMGSVLEVPAGFFSRWIRGVLTVFLAAFLVPVLLEGRGVRSQLESLAGGLVSLGATGELTKMAVKRLSKYCEDRVIRKEPHPSPELVKEAVENLLQDLPLLRTRLYTASKDMYGDYDRLVAEANLRVNVGLAGTVLSCVLATQVDPLGVLVCIPMTLLAYRGLTKLREANDLLVQAVVTELVKSPRFEEYIDALGPNWRESAPGYQ